MGVEAEYNKKLSGTDGYSEYQVNKYGYNIDATQYTWSNPPQIDEMTNKMK